jgi:hypothetical protein
MARNRAAMGRRWSVGVEQHDDEQKQRDDRARVHQQNEERQEVGLERDEQPGHADKRQHEAERRVDGVAVQHDARGGDERERGEEVEEKVAHAVKEPGARSEEQGDDPREIETSRSLATMNTEPSRHLAVTA